MVVIRYLALHEPSDTRAESNWGLTDTADRTVSYCIGGLALGVAMNGVHVEDDLSQRHLVLLVAIRLSLNATAQQATDD